MSPRDTRGGAKERQGSRRRSTVVGSTVRDVSSRLEGRGLPRGGIRERDGLKVAEGARPDSTIIGTAQEGRTGTRRALRIVALISGALAVLLVSVGLAILILSHTSVFAITTINTYDSEHITADEVARLAQVPEGSTLLNLDFSVVEDGIKKNPWVSEVQIERVFPDTLRITVHERSIGALVAMGTGGLAWYLGDDNVWIEPAHFETDATTSFNDVALDEAEELGVVLIADVPASVSPVAGSVATDACLEAVRQFREELSAGFSQKVVSYSAASADDISCVLNNGVEVAFGSTSGIDTKEAVASRILDEYEGQVTYINVRVPSHPTYRRVNSSYVHEGTGPTGTMVTEPVVETSEEEDDEEDLTY